MESGKHKNPLEVPELIEASALDPFDLLDDDTDQELNTLLSQLANNRTINHMRSHRYRQLP